MIMCPHCGWLFDATGLVPDHDVPQCPGSHQNPRNPETDRRPLWNGNPNPYLAEAKEIPMEEPSLGPCCICESEVRVRTLIMLKRRSPISGHGWGCVACHLPSDGAMAVVCDDCCDVYGPRTPDRLVFACRGYPGTEGRIPMSELTGEHEHDMRFHPEAA